MYYSVYTEELQNDCKAPVPRENAESHRGPDARLQLYREQRARRGGNLSSSFHSSPDKVTEGGEKTPLEQLSVAEDGAVGAAANTCAPQMKRDWQEEDARIECVLEELPDEQVVSGGSCLQVVPDAFRHPFASSNTMLLCFEENQRFHLMEEQRDAFYDQFLVPFFIAIQRQCQDAIRDQTALAQRCVKAETELRIEKRAVSALETLNGEKEKWCAADVMQLKQLLEKEQLTHVIATQQQEERRQRELKAISNSFEAQIDRLKAEVGRLNTALTEAAESARISEQRHRDDPLPANTSDLPTPSAACRSEFSPAPIEQPPQQASQSHLLATPSRNGYLFTATSSSRAWTRQWFSLRRGVLYAAKDMCPPDAMVMVLDLSEITRIRASRQASSAATPLRGTQPLHCFSVSYRHSPKGDTTTRDFGCADRTELNLWLEVFRLAPQLHRISKPQHSNPTSVNSSLKRAETAQQREQFHQLTSECEREVERSLARSSDDDL